MRSRRAPSVGAIVVLIAAAALLVLRPASDERERRGGEGEPGERAEARVLRVIDGDTIEVSIDGTVEDVRYIGVDTPESVDPDSPVECFGEEAAALNEGLVADRTVTLRFDVERRDAYGRLLAYVYAAGQLVNAELVRRGRARTLTIPPNDSRARLFARLERRAGHLGRGLWAAC